MKFTCPCCGYAELSRPSYQNLIGPPFQSDAKPPYSRFYGEPSYDVCGCCGFEFGNDDDPGTTEPETFDHYLRKWIENGCVWFNPSAKPVNWNLKKQLQEAGINCE
jgi:hypothetical protein